MIIRQATLLPIALCNLILLCFTLPAMAQSVPGVPVIAWLPEEVAEGDIEITWNMWWGENGTFWSLTENGEAVHQANITANSPQAQTGTVTLPDRTIGTYIYQVSLCNAAGCTKSDAVTLNVAKNVSGGGTTGSVFTPDARIPVDRDSTTLSVSTGLPLQIHVRQNETVAFTFDTQLASVLASNPNIVDLAIDNETLTVTGRASGRTGLKIQFTDESIASQFMGLRVDATDGTLPGLPSPLALGSVSEDSTADLQFWQEFDQGRRIDVRYIYINGGPINGWQSWDPDRVISFCKESMALGIVPFFVFYNIPDGGESYWTDLEHVQDSEYMTAYYQNLADFLTDAASVMQGELYGIVLEPDFLGYLQQNSGLSPSQISTADGTIVDTVTRINKTIADSGDNLLFGWQLNLWADPTYASARGVIRRIDPTDLGLQAGLEAVKAAAANTAQYAIEAGVLSHGADFLSIDKYGLDAGISSPDDPEQSTWFWNADHWNAYLQYAHTLGETANVPVVLWQIPVGHINSSTATNSQTGEHYPDLNNTSQHYEDSAATFFLGDSFNPETAIRRNWFSTNAMNDPKITQSGDIVTWKNHLDETSEAGVMAVLLGAGVGDSTDGVGSPPTDSYYFIDKIQAAYGTTPSPTPSFDAAKLLPIFHLLLIGQ